MADYTKPPTFVSLAVLATYARALRPSKSIYKEPHTMPQPKGTRYRVVKTPGGRQVRLAFADGSNDVVETKALPKKKERRIHKKKKTT